MTRPLGINVCRGGLIWAASIVLVHWTAFKAGAVATAQDGYLLLPPHFHSGGARGRSMAMGELAAAPKGS